MSLYWFWKCGPQLCPRVAVGSNEFFCLSWRQCPVWQDIRQRNNISFSSGESFMGSTSCLQAATPGPRCAPCVYKRVQFWLDVDLITTLCRACKLALIAEVPSYWGYVDLYSWISLPCVTFLLALLPCFCFSLILFVKFANWFLCIVCLHESFGIVSHSHNSVCTLSLPTYTSW